MVKNKLNFPTLSEVGDSQTTQEIKQTWLNSWVFVILFVCKTLYTVKKHFEILEQMIHFRKKKKKNSKPLPAFRISFTRGE